MKRTVFFSFIVLFCLAISTCCSEKKTNAKNFGRYLCMPPKKIAHFATKVVEAVIVNPGKKVSSLSREFVQVMIVDPIKDAPKEGSEWQNIKEAFSLNSFFEGFGLKEYAQTGRLYRSCSK